MASGCVVSRLRLGLGLRSRIASNAYDPAVIKQGSSSFPNRMTDSLSESRADPSGYLKSIRGNASPSPVAATRIMASAMLKGLPVGLSVVPDMEIRRLSRPPSRRAALPGIARGGKNRMHLYHGLRPELRLRSRSP